MSFPFQNKTLSFLRRPILAEVRTNSLWSAKKQKTFSDKIHTVWDNFLSYQLLLVHQLVRTLRVSLMCLCFVVVIVHTVCEPYSWSSFHKQKGHQLRWPLFSSGSSGSLRLLSTVRYVLPMGLGESIWPRLWTWIVVSADHWPEEEGSWQKVPRHLQSKERWWQIDVWQCSPAPPPWVPQKLTKGRLQASVAP